MCLHVAEHIVALTDFVSEAVELARVDAPAVFWCDPDRWKHTPP